MQKPSRKSLTLTALVSALVLAATAATSTAGANAAAAPSSQRVLASGLGPVFQIALHKGTVYYADGGTVSKITPQGPKEVAPVPDVSGVEFSLNGRKWATASGGGPGAVVTIKGPGRKKVVSRVGRYESKVNPDKGVTYGTLAGGSACSDRFLEGTEVPAGPYQGLVDSHPYQLAALPRGAWAVAEAGGNGILRVGPGGGISTIALLPPQPITFTRARVAALHAPDCLVGVTYAFEPVPTDVERGSNGSLYVSTLPGGPESPVLGARGSVYKISKRGAVKRVATGFLGATNLAVVRGRIYVAELFAGKITKVYKGEKSTRLTIDSPLSVEATGKTLYVGTFPGPGGPGQIVSIPRVR